MAEAEAKEHLGAHLSLGVTVGTVVQTQVAAGQRVEAVLFPVVAVGLAAAAVAVAVLAAMAGLVKSPSQ